MGVCLLFPSASRLAAEISVPAPRDRSLAAANAPLASLAGGALASRFHAWRGQSGRRYIATVFPVAGDLADKGLPDFTSAVIITATRCGGDGRRLLHLCEGDHRAALDQRLLDRLAGMADEWHLHLLAETRDARLAALADLAAGAQASRCASHSSVASRMPSSAR